jgi:hypothetical protein
LLPAFDSGEDALWVGGPDEGFGFGIGIGDEAIDGKSSTFFILRGEKPAELPL